MRWSTGYPFLNDGYPEEWVRTLTALEKYDFTHIIPRPW